MADRRKFRRRFSRVETAEAAQAEEQRLREEARRRAEAEAARIAAEEQAAREAEEQRQREEARLRAEADAARKAAEEQAAREAEEQRQREEARRRAEADAARKAAEEQAAREAEEQRQREEARRRAEADAARKAAEEQAAREAEEQRQREEARRRAEADAARKAAEEQAAREAEEQRLREEARRRAEADAARKAAEEQAAREAEEQRQREEAEAAKDPWSRLPTFAPDNAHLSRNRIITATREDPAHISFDVLRTRLLQALSENGWRRVAITSPTKDCGKTFTAANLAISLSRQENCRTLLLDCDMRRPSLHKVLGVSDPGSMGDMLRGTLSPQDHLRRMGDNQMNAGRNIAFGFNGLVEPYASELLQDPMTEDCLNRLDAELDPDVVLFDLPPALYYDDVIAFRPLFDGVLLVVGGGITTEKEIKEVERRLGDSTPLLGMVLNKAENTETSRYRY